MNALAAEPRCPAPHLPPPRRTVRPASPAGPDPVERDLLYALLAPCLGCMEAAEAMEALIARYGSLAAATAATANELIAMPAVGEAGAAALQAVHRAAIQLDRQRHARRPVLARPAAWRAHLRRGAAQWQPAALHALFLDRSGGLLAEATLGGTMITAAGQAIRHALALDATGLVLARRVEEAVPTALDSDRASVRSLAQAAAVVGVTLLDVVVLGGRGEVSLGDV